MPETPKIPQSFNVVFKGELVKGATPEQVKNNIAKLFSADPAKLAHLFSGKAVIIKKGLDLAGADKYESVLRRAGAIIELVEVAGEVPSEVSSKIPGTAGTQATAPPKPQAEGPAATQKKTDGKSKASERTPMEQTIVAAAPAAAAAPPQAPADLTVAEVGATLIEHVAPPPANFDTTHLNLAELGVDLVEAEKVAAAQYDLSGLTLDPVGVDLVDRKPVTPAEFDTSGLSLSDPANDPS